MTREEIIEALERVLKLDGSPVGECFFTYLPKTVLAEAIELIKYQDHVIKKQDKANTDLLAENIRIRGEKIAQGEMFLSAIKRERDATIILVSEGIKSVVCKNTYPSYDQNGKAVNVWRTKEGYKAIDKFVEGFREYIREITEEAPHESESTHT